MSTRPDQTVGFLRGFRARLRLTNYEGKRDDYRFLRVEEWQGPFNVTRQLVDIHQGDTIKDAEKSLYLFDDGQTVEAWYVAGWKHVDPFDRTTPIGHVFLQRFPLNFDGNGERITRADGRGEVDYSSWQLGPRRTYHLKVEDGSG